MQITSVLNPNFTAPTLFSQPIAVSVPTATDLVSLSGGTQSADEQKKMYRKLEWVGFGAEMIGGTLTLVGHPAVGLTMAAAGAALMVYAGYKRQRV